MPSSFTSTSSVTPHHSYSLKRVLVVGGEGYIGIHVVQALQKQGYKPIVFDNHTSKANIQPLPDVEIIRGDLLIQEDIDKACEGMDAVIHLAAKKDVAQSLKEPDIVAKTNISGTINLLSACNKNGIHLVIFSSSAAVYGTPEKVPLSESHSTKPENFYGYTKLAAEQLLEWYAQISDIRSISLRYFNAVGCTDAFCVLEQGAANLFPVVLDTAAGNRSHVSIYGTDWDTRDGTAVRDYIHVEDLAVAHVQALNYLSNTTTCKHTVLNLGTGRGVSVQEVIQGVQEVTGKDFEVRKESRREGDCAVSVADASQAQELLGWRAEHTDLHRTIQSMWQWWNQK
eukprot:gb/GECH01001417.1/.p1 GENE.gb/GECH01001417.1/~~gb/GECH01001417.1/.p1  ORF type:complete len:341 (+),score=68.91 gb/GECH01001417.1/:1-1023(+)